MTKGERRRAVAAGPVEGPWELPDRWAWRRLGDVFPLSYGKSLPLRDRTSTGSVPVFGSSGRVGFHSEAITSGPAVLVGRKGAAGSVHYSDGPCWPIDTTYFVEANTGLELRYGYHLLRHARLASLDQSTAIPSLSRDTYSEQIVPVAPLELQFKIARRIDELFDEISDAELALTTACNDLETYRKSLLKAAYDGALTAEWRASNPPTQPGHELLEALLTSRRATWMKDCGNQGKKYVEPQGPDLSGLPELPQGWCWASLQQIAFVSGGVAVDAKRKPVDPVEVPYLRVANVQRGRLDLSVLKTITMSPPELAKYRLKPGDILLNEGGDRDKVGRGWVWTGAIDPCVHQNHVFKARPASDLIDPELVSSYLNELGRRFFLDESKQTTNLASISLTKVGRAPVPVPPTAEARAIRRALSEAEQGVTAVGSLGVLGATSTSLRQSILAAAFRGDLVT